MIGPGSHKKIFVLRPNHSKDDWPDGPLPRSTLCVCAETAKANPHGWAREGSIIITEACPKFPSDVDTYLCYRCNKHSTFHSVTPHLTLIRMEFLYADGTYVRDFLDESN